MKLKDIIHIIRDKRFSWRFKLADIILHDTLRPNLAFIRIRAKEAISFLESRANDPKLKYAIRQNKAIIKDTEELFQYPHKFSGFDK